MTHMHAVYPPIWHATFVTCHHASLPSSLPVSAVNKRRQQGHGEERKRPQKLTGRRGGKDLTPNWTLFHPPNRKHLPKQCKIEVLLKNINKLQRHKKVGRKHTWSPCCLKNTHQWKHTGLILISIIWNSLLLFFNPKKAINHLNYSTDL